MLARYRQEQIWRMRTDLFEKSGQAAFAFETMQRMRHNCLMLISYVCYLEQEAIKL